MSDRDLELAEVADAAYAKGHTDALGAALDIDAIAQLREVWMPIERALVDQDRISGPAKNNYDPHITVAPQPEDVAVAVLRAAEPKLRALFSAALKDDAPSEEGTMPAAPSAPTRQRDPADGETARLTTEEP